MCTRPPGLLTEVVGEPRYRKESTREGFAFIAGKNVSPLGNSNCPLIITAQTHYFQDLQALCQSNGLFFSSVM